MWCQYRHLWPGGVNWEGCRLKLLLTTDSRSVLTVLNRMVSIKRWELTHTLDLCLGPSTALGSRNNSSLILASQNPSSARERKIRQGGNHNRGWGRHIRLAQSESSGYKTLVISPVVTGITCSKSNILTANSRTLFHYICDTLCIKLINLINPLTAHGKIKRYRKGSIKKQCAINTKNVMVHFWYLYLMSPLFSQSTAAV